MDLSPGADVATPAVYVLLTDACFDELLPIRNAMSSPLLNVLLCCYLHLVAAVNEVDFVHGSTSVSVSSGETSLPSNAPTHLRPAYTHLQAATTTSRSHQILRHWLGSEPPTDSMDGDPLITGGFFNYILYRPVMHLNDIALNLYKPTLREAPLSVF